jgi:diadenosine tetraphosphate (Ap4A) HIT family hydrolase
MNDARYPWVILVPQRAALVEWSDLGVADRHLLLDEAVVVGEVISRLWEVDKINTASLGNMVAQLHVHVIGRRQGDPAWPGPVWGRGEARPYEPDALSTLVATLRKGLGCL